METQNDFPILTMIDAFCEIIPGADFSFGHIVLSDYNLLDSHIDFCLKISQIQDWSGQQLKDGKSAKRVVTEEAAITSFLKCLKDIPEENRKAEMDRYQGYAD
jgi:hypothetical protein